VRRSVLHSGHVALIGLCSTRLHLIVLRRVQALVTAIQHVYKCSRDDAEDIFAHGVNYTPEEIDYRWQQTLTFGLGST